VTDDDPDTPTESPEHARTPARERTISSQTLFGSARQVVIVHNGDRYILRLTRQGKLILNK